MAARAAAHDEAKERTMNGIHDLGGMDGFGKVAPTPSEPVFAADWERTVFGIFPFLFRAGWLTEEATFRAAIEAMDPVEYLSTTYYEHWLHATVDSSISSGQMTAEEIEERTRYYLQNPDAALPEPTKPELDQELVDWINPLIRDGASTALETSRPPAFVVGDKVTVVDDSPFSHTRRARYIRGRTGTVVASWGAYLYFDEVARTGEHVGEHVYTVQFTGEELWGPDSAEPNTRCSFDVWEPYIRRAEEEVARS
jgi:nitrile hydratase